MKKLILILSILFTSFLNAQTKNDIKKWNLKGKVKKITSRLDKNSNLITEIWEFNKKGWLKQYFSEKKERKTYSNLTYNVKTKVIYSYDKINRKIKVDSIVRKTEIPKNSDNNESDSLIEESDIIFVETTNFKTFYKYERNKKVIERYKENKLQDNFTYLYELNKVNDTIKITKLKNGNKKELTIRKYNNNHKILQEENFILDKYIETIDFDYNSKGLLIKKTSKIGKNKYESIFKYNNNNTKKEEIFQNISKNSNKKTITEFKYDSNKNITETISNFNGKKITRKFERDTKGNWIKAEHYEDGILKETFKQEFEYF